jgi:rhamnogalacturonan endolyase
MVLSLTIAVTSLIFPSNSNNAVIEMSAETNVSSHLENLDRGVVAVRSGNGNFVSWRFLKTDTDDTKFELYRDGELVYTSNPGEPTCFWDSGAGTTAGYNVKAYNGNTLLNEGGSGVWGSGSNYWDIFFAAPTGNGFTYSPNDMSVGDVDGDGQYEYILKWDPSNSKDNSQSGVTGNTIFDCYEMNGTRLWRIDLGRNIRSGAHYSPFLVYDFDGDGKSEFAVRTSDGSIDGKGTVIGDASKDYRNGDGQIITGNEYLTVFNGETGAAINTITYPNVRGTVSKAEWGDDYGGRSERFLACTADLGGDNLSMVFCRGYYTKTYLAAVDLIDGKLKLRWQFKAEKSSDPYYSQGNHNLAVGDVDFDGKDEIMYGSCAIDDNGTGMYSTGRGHGDAMHLSDFAPENPGLEVWQVHESSPYGGDLRDAATGEILFRVNASDDTGRGIAGNFLPGNDSAEFKQSGSNDVYDWKGNVVTQWGNISSKGQNSVLWWNGGLERGNFDQTMVDQYDPNSKKMTRVFTAADVSTNNGTKSNACLSADIFGDWREEMIFRLADNSGIRIYTTNIETDYRIPTLMHDLQYREQVAHQNAGYNQPPHPSFFLGTGYEVPTIENSGGAVVPIKPIEYVTPDTTAVYKLKNVSTGLYMNIAESASGVSLGLTSNSDDNSQKFSFISANDGWYYIRPLIGGEYNLDVAKKSTADGTAITTYTPNNGDNQQFRLIDNGLGVVTVITKITNGQSSLAAAENTVVQNQRSNNENEQWVLEISALSIQTTTTTTTAPPEFIYGDFDNDKIPGKMSDIVVLSKYIKGTLNFSDLTKKAADVNIDEKIDVEDLQIIVNYLMGEIKILPL